MACGIVLGGKTMLFLFTCINLLVFMDRGALAAVISLLKDGSGLGLNSIEAGSLGSAFMLGYILASPIFAYFSNRIHPMYLMAIGNSIWAGAVFLTGMSNSYPLILIARSLTGIGEASFVSLAPPCIIDTAPLNKQTQWIGIFYSSSALGYAIGFIFGAQVSTLLDSWKYPFVIEAFLMVPFILISIICYKDPKLYAKKIDGNSEKIHEQIWILMKIPVFVFMSLGYSCFQFTVGGLAFWGPDFIGSYYNVSGNVAAYCLGSVTVFCGIVGTISGSFILDKLMKNYDSESEKLHISVLSFIRVEKASFMTPISFFIGICFGVAGLVLSLLATLPGNLIIFLAGLALGEFFIFLTNSPIAIITMYCVPIHLRGQANAISIFIMHILGDFPSPTIIGAWFDTIGEFNGIICTFLWLLNGTILMIICWNISVISI